MLAAGLTVASINAQRLFTVYTSSLDSKVLAHSVWYFFVWIEPVNYLPPTKGEVYVLARDVCLSVCLLARLLRNSMHGFVWNFASGQMSGRGQTDQLLSPIQIILRMPELENLKIADLSKSVKQAPHSEQATGHGKHCREILFMPRCSQRAREFPGSGRLFCTTYGCGLRGVNLAQFLDFGLWWRYMRSTECSSSSN